MVWCDGAPLGQKITADISDKYISTEIGCGKVLLNTQTILMNAYTLKIRCHLFMVEYWSGN